jgi:multidrug efflux system outer membrane protein
MTFTVIAERIGLALFVLPLLAGCAVGPDYTTPSVPVPASWANADKNAAAQPLQLADWWTSLDDPTLSGLI